MGRLAPRSANSLAPYIGHSRRRYGLRATEVTVFRPRLPQNLSRRGEENSGHQGRNAKIGPGGPGSPNSCSGNHHNDVADRIVARTQPDRTHVGVAILVPHQQQHAPEVGGESQRAYPPINSARGTPSTKV